MSPEQLTTGNLFYRHPELYDRARADGGATATLIEELTDTYGPPGASTLLDLGCGTARDLEHLAKRYTCVGVDLQPQLITYARHTRPTLDVRVGDLRTFRLGRPVDVITCLGNTLSYVHTNAGLQAAFATFRAHTHPGSLLILHLLVAASLPAVNGAAARAAHDPTVGAEVTISYTWDLSSQVETLRREWQLDHGHQEHDVIRRRVIFPRELEHWLDSSGFTLLEMFGHPARRDGPLRGPDAYVVARRVQ